MTKDKEVSDDLTEDKEAGDHLDKERECGPTEYTETCNVLSPLI